MNLKKLKIFTRIGQLEKKVEELYDVVGYLLDDDDSNRELIEQQQDEIEALKKKVYLDYLKAKDIDNDELSKFKYDKTEC